jgi:hypothetical protein
MTRLLTLSISETWGNNYKIVTYNLDTNHFVALEIKNSDFRNSNGDICWDVFGVTFLDGLKPARDEFHVPIGTPRILEYFNRQKMIQFFDGIHMSAKRFLMGRLDYGIIKVDKITDIRGPRLYFTSDKNTKESIDLKNKDFRWVNYWKNISSDQTQQKVKQWIVYINQDKNHIYLLLYHRKKFTDPKTNKWIAGFYCL